jgi:hypothetical protein
MECAKRAHRTQVGGSAQESVPNGRIMNGRALQFRPYSAIWSRGTTSALSFAIVDAGLAEVDFVELSRSGLLDDRTRRDDVRRFNSRLTTPLRIFS